VRPARALQQDQAIVASALLQEVRCQPPAKRIKRSVHHHAAAAPAETVN